MSAEIKRFPRPMRYPRPLSLVKVEHSLGKAIDISGNRYTRLVAIRKEGVTKWGDVIWKVVCDCGNIIFTTYGKLVSGSTKSCGCLRKEIVSNIHKKYDDGYIEQYYREYKIWKNIKNRCLNENNSAYMHYGGRGITICSEWKNDFTKFVEDMGKSPSKKHSIDRIDNDGGYSKANCRWATKKEQANNRSSSRKIEYSGYTMTLQEWSEYLGIKRTTLVNRIDTRGWSIHKAFTKPVGGKIPNEISRPKSRRECSRVSKPCVWVSCKYNLFMDVERTKMKIYGDDPLCMDKSCALDEAEKGGLKLDEICEIYNLSRERIRQIVEHALRRMRFQRVTTPISRRL